MIPESSIEQRVNEHANHIVVLQSTVQNLEKGQENLQLSMTQGFVRIEQMISSKNAEPPRVTMTLLASLVTVGALAVGAFWTTVQLLVIPIKEAIDADRMAHSSAYSSVINYIDKGLALAEDHSTDRHETQDDHLSRLEEDVATLERASLREAAKHGAIEAIEAKRVSQEAQMQRAIDELRKDICHPQNDRNP